MRLSACGHTSTGMVGLITFTPSIRTSNAVTRGSASVVMLLAVFVLTGCGGGSTGTNGAGASNPVPTISTISPNTATRGGSAFTLTVSGSNFVASTAVQWNGSARQTTLVNAGQVTAQISADDISVAATDMVTVVNPGPGGGLSNSLPFNIPCVLAPPTPASSQTLARLGAYYFDGWAGNYASYHLKQIVNSTYQNREPLSGWRDDNTCAVEQQLAWAHSFGLNFFVFDWLPDKFISADPGENVNSAIEITHSLPDRHGMQYAIMYVNSPPFDLGSSDWGTAVNEWISYMTDPAYVTVNGKPLFVVYDMRQLRQDLGSSSATVAAFNQLRAAARAAGLPGVYIVGDFFVSDGAPAQDGLFADLSMAVADGYDAVSTYGYAFAAPLDISGAQPFATLANTGDWVWNQAALKSPIPMIPVAMDGWDTGPEGASGGEPGRQLFWFNRAPQDVATFIKNIIGLAESNPQARPEPSPVPPLVLIEAWNELLEGSILVPTAGDGTSYGDALGSMLATPASQIRSVLTVADSGPTDPKRAANGHLADATGAPIAGASITISDTPLSGSYAQYQLSGQAPSAAAQGIIGFRVNSDNGNVIWPSYWFAGPAAANISLYQVSYVQPADGVQRVSNSDFSAGTQYWTLQGQAQIAPSDRGTGQMLQVVATPDQFATLDSTPFPVTPDAAFQFSCFARVSSSKSGYFIVAFQDASGNYLTIPGPSGGAVHAESIPLTAANISLGVTTTDSAGNFQFSLTSVGTSQVKLEAAYAGDSQHWPAYGQTGP